MSSATFLPLMESAWAPRYSLASVGEKILLHNSRFVVCDLRYGLTPVPPVIAALPETSGLVSVLTKSHAACWFLPTFGTAICQPPNAMKGAGSTAGNLSHFLVLAFHISSEPGSTAEPTLPEIFDCLGSAAITPVSPQPIDSATWPPATAALTSPNEKFSALGGPSLEARIYSSNPFTQPGLLIWASIVSGSKNIAPGWFGLLV